MNKPIVILGHGGHARVVLDVLRCLGWPVAGFLTPDLAAGTDVQGLPVLGDDGWLEGERAGDYTYVLGLGLLPHRPTLRADLYRRVRHLGLDTPTLIHPSAIVARDVLIERGAQVMAGAVIQPGCLIGEDALLNTGCRVDHDCQIGAHAHLAPGGVLCGGVRVGEGAFIGAGAVVLPGVRIGEGAQVAAGATVRRDLPPRVRHIPGHPDKPL
ncbi:acetyltransferase [Thiofaba sp. EF100]|uniref:acetyltransferase n=1 Tax=Thiofaba sp. EF100 TaxID=3121274 RepID=UPI0032221B8C